MSAPPELVPLVGIGWPVIGDCVAVVRLHPRLRFAVGVQDRMRSGGVGRVWRSLGAARRRAAYLATVHGLPIVESL